MRKVNGLPRLQEDRGATAISHWYTIGGVPTNSGIEVEHMTRERKAIDRDDLRRRYEDGASTVELARLLDCTPDTITKYLRACGARIRTASEAARLAKGVDVDIDDIISRYNNGDSVLAIAKAFGVSRPTIIRRLAAAGLDTRTVSEANKIRMSRASIEARRLLTAPANAERRRLNVDFAKRNPDRERPTISTATTRTRKIGKGEAELVDFLIARGVTVETQVAIYGYNLNITIGRVAVEVWWGEGYPVRRLRLARRTVDLANLGWSTIFVWCSGIAPTDITADAVISFVDQTSGYPDTVSPQYRVIRCNGEIVATGKPDDNNIALIPTSRDGTYSAVVDNDVSG
jgi:transcriptional regulator with XRE-family HTH domain